MKHESMNIRRVIRANRLLAEQGHANDTLAALDELAALRKDAERYRWLLAQLANMRRADFFEPLRQHFYDVEEKYPDAEDVQTAIDAAMTLRPDEGTTEVIKL